MSTFLENYVAKLRNTEGASDTVAGNARPLLPDNRPPVQVDAVRIGFVDVPIYAGVSFLQSSNAYHPAYINFLLGEWYKKQGRVLQLLSPHAVAVDTLQQVIDTTGEILWIQGVPLLTKTQWGVLTLSYPQTCFKGAVVMILPCEMPTQVHYQFPWVPHQQL